MYLEDLAKMIYNYLDYYRAPLRMEEEIEGIRWVIGMIEEGLSYREIAGYLRNDYLREERKDTDKGKLLKILRRHNPKLDKLAKDCRKER